MEKTMNLAKVEMLLETLNDEMRHLRQEVVDLKQEAVELKHEIAEINRALDWYTEGKPSLAKELLTVLDAINTHRR
jgi:predicted  nucleic acid-binding Zn-ribbon protein